MAISAGRPMQVEHAVIRDGNTEFVIPVNMDGCVAQQIRLAMLAITTDRPKKKKPLNIEELKKTFGIKEEPIETGGTWFAKMESTDA